MDVAYPTSLSELRDAVAGTFSPYQLSKWCARGLTRVPFDQSESTRRSVLPHEILRPRIAAQVMVPLTTPMSLSKTALRLSTKEMCHVEVL